MRGLALGNGGIAPVLAAGDFVEVVASIGVVLLLLPLGLEFNTAELTYSLRRHVNRWLAHPDDEQLMLRVLGTTLVVAALAELVSVSAAVGAFLVGLTLTGTTAERARAVLAPLRDLFAAAFFLAISFAVSPADLLPALPAALGLAVAGVLTKLATGWYAARRDGVAPRGRLRAGTALIARGEFSVVIMSLAGAASPGLGPVVTGYVLLLATIGPLVVAAVATAPTAQEFLNAVHSGSVCSSLSRTCQRGANGR